MSVLTPTKSYQPKVHFSQYIRSEDKPAEGQKPQENTPEAEPEEAS